MAYLIRDLSKHRVSVAVKAACVLTLVVGCATAPPPEATTEPSQTVGAKAPADLMRRAGSAPEERAASLYLQAGWAYLEADDPAGARAAFDAVEPGWLDANGLTDYRLLTAKIALIDGDPERAEQALSRLSRSALASPRAAGIESEVCAARGDFDCALAGLVRVAGENPEENERIWEWLNADTSLPIAPARAGGVPEVLEDWRSLHGALVTAYSLTDARDRARAWLAAHPDHPAALIPPSAVSAITAYQPARMHVGLVVPLTGPLARAGEAVRDGFIAAALLAGTAGRLDLTIYDAAAEPLPVIYERLLSDRVELLIGPLQRDTVGEMNALHPEIQTLLLNYLEAGTPPAPGLHQVGLAIEDEALTISSRLDTDDVRQALVFHNYEDWSLRARKTLVEQMETDRIQLTVQPFTDVRTITEAVGTAMHVAGSQARRDQLAATLGEELEFLPRARDDVDAVVALISNGEANALVPALRFHFADHLPIYASSQVTRASRRDRLGELRGFHVSELPFFLQGDPLYGAMNEPFGLDRNPFASLVALGSDAYRLAERLQIGGAVSDLPMLGSTGLLRSRSDGRISRELAWGTISARGVTAEPANRR